MKKVIHFNRVCFTFSSLDDVLGRKWFFVENTPYNGKDYFTFECSLSDSPLYTMRVSLRPVSQFDLFSGRILDSVDQYSCGLFRCDYRFGGKRLFIASRPINHCEVKELYNRLCSCVNR